MNTIEMIKNLARRNSVVASGDVAALIEEFDAVSEKLAEVVAENAALKNQEPIAWHICIGNAVTTDRAEAEMWRGKPLVIADIETPATAAAVAAIEARGVEKLAAWAGAQESMAADDGDKKEAAIYRQLEARAHHYAAELQEGK